MICPRCSAGQISQSTDQCVVCGFAPLGSLVVGKPVVDEVRETVQREVEGLFHIDQLVHHGTRSVVYQAISLRTGQRVALKAIPLQRGLQVDIAEFERLASVSSSLSHSHMARVLEFGRTGAMLWYSSEWVDGRSLQELLDEGPVDFEKCLHILEQVASALDYMHRRGVVHGNVKPSNILLDSRGWARVADACVMKAFESDDGIGDALGVEPDYLAPECQLGRGLGALSDQFSLAAVARKTLGGSEELEDGPGRAMVRALAKTPAKRFPSILDFVEELRGGPGPVSSAAQFLLPEGRPSRSDVLLIDPADSASRLPSVKVALSALVVFAIIFLSGIVWLRPPLWASWLGP